MTKGIQGIPFDQLLKMPSIGRAVFHGVSTTLLTYQKACWSTGGIPLDEWTSGVVRTDCKTAASIRQLEDTNPVMTAVITSKMSSDIITVSIVEGIQREDDPDVAFLLFRAVRLAYSAKLSKDLPAWNGKPWKGQIDVISGGFPCQDISPAGKQRG